MGIEFDKWPLKMKLCAVMCVMRKCNGLKKDEKLPKKFDDLVGEYNRSILYTEIINHLIKNKLILHEVDESDQMFQSLGEFYETHWYLMEETRVQLLTRHNALETEDLDRSSVEYIIKELPKLKSALEEKIKISVDSENLEQVQRSLKNIEFGDPINLNDRLKTYCAFLECDGQKGPVPQTLTETNAIAAETRNGASVS